jgi:hypothetical protein
MAKPPSKPVILEALGWAERSGLNLGGCFLFAMGMYSGQYAKLFPEHTQDYAGGLCWVVAASGALIAFYHVIRGIRQTP